MTANYSGRASPPPASIDIFARERQDHIARIVEEHGRAGVADLSALLLVSRQTIRKDLTVLAADGRVLRAHGGAMAAGRSQHERAYDARERLQRAEKAAIGRAAAALVRDGESIVLDASTTALYLARAIRARAGWSQLTVMTNGLRVALELVGHPGVTVAMPGGWVRWEALSLVGGIGQGVFDRINVQTAFVGAGGLTTETGLSDVTEDEAQIKRSMIGNAREIVAMVDHTKWGRTAFATFCPAERVARVITDAVAAPELVQRFRARGVEVQVVEVEVPAGRICLLGRARGRREQPIVRAVRQRPTV